MKGRGRADASVNEATSSLEQLGDKRGPQMLRNLLRER